MKALHKVLPGIASGYELNPDVGFFSIILPEQTVNLVSNPSLEKNTAGYTAVGVAVLDRVATFQRRGAWSLRTMPGAGFDTGFYYGTVSHTASLAYTLSLDLKGVGGKYYKIYYAATTGVQVGPTLRVKATGNWQRIDLTFFETHTASRRIYVLSESPSIGPFYVDGLQDEQKAYPTTYCDGDAEGFVPGTKEYWWVGAPHASTSLRSSQTRSGGKVVTLKDYGFLCTAFNGLGSAPPENVYTPFGLLDGSYYQRTRMPQRQFSLVGTISGSNLLELQRVRQQLIEAFRHDAVTPNQPLMLRYQPYEQFSPFGEPLDIVCLYEGGLEGQTNNLYIEKIGLVFSMPTPYLQLSGETGAKLNARNAYVSVNSEGALYQSLSGGWSSVFGHVTKSAYRSKSSLIGVFIVVNNTFVYSVDLAAETSTLIGTVAGGGVFIYSMVVSQDGYVYIGGDFTTIDGVAAVNVARWDGTSWSAIGAGLAVGLVRQLAASNDGTVYAYLTTPTSEIWKWDGSSWAEIAAGSVNAAVSAMLIGPDGTTLYIGGAFTSVYGTTVNKIGSYGGTTWTNLSSTNPNGNVSNIAFLPNGNLIVTGTFTTINGVSASYIAQWNGTAWTALGSGLGSSADNSVVPGLVTSADGIVYVLVEDMTTAGGVKIPGMVAGWNGRRWFPAPIGLLVSTIFMNPQTLEITPQGKLFVGYLDLGAGQTISLSGSVTVSNAGSAKVYPKVRFRLIGTVGDANLYYLGNETTGSKMYFENLSIQVGELLLLDLDPESPSLTSSTRGNLISSVSAVSDLAGFGLNPGDNVIGCLGFGSSEMEAAMFWKERHHGVDSAPYG